MLPALVALLVTLDPGHSPIAKGAVSARGRDEVEFNLEMVARVSKETRRGAEGEAPADPEGLRARHAAPPGRERRR
ncbi:MAG: N-acetylmuramoyl-L-alanine amidase [Myxococcales bacterium]